MYIVVHKHKFSYLKQILSLQESVAFGCISVPAGGVCFDKISAASLDLSAAVVSLYTS